MIVVEVVVPSLGRQYDFDLEETLPVGSLIQEMTAVICQREHCTLEETDPPLGLYGRAQARRLDPELSLQESGVVNGQRLILI